VSVNAELGHRLDQVRSLMRERSWGVLVAYYGGQHNMLRPDPIMLMTDYRVLGPSVLVIPLGGQLQLIITPPWDLPRAREAVTAAAVNAVNETDLVSAMVRAAAGSAGQVALAGTEVMPVAVARALVGALGYKPADASQMIRSVCRTRQPFELSRVEKAAAIADEGFRHLCEIARPGMREYELAAELEHAMQVAGSEDNFGLMATGVHNVAVRAVTDRRLERGDLIVSEITPCYRGYFAQLCRTLALGVPSAMQQQKFDLLLRAEDAGLAQASPGRPSSGIAGAINDVIAAAGYADYCRPPYMRTRGHGLGLGGVAPSDLNDTTPGTLERNMTMVIHPNQYIPETGYLMLGDTVVIEDGGPRLLTRTPRRLFFKEI